MSLPTYNQELNLTAIQPSLAIKSDSVKKIIEQFHFEPEAQTTDYTPKAEDYIYVPFRAISATIVASGTWRATDFSDEKVLKNLLSMLLGVPAQKDHSSSVDKNVGVIASTKWTLASTDSEGNLIPAGVDVVYKIDAKSNVELARALTSTPPTVQGSSLSIKFEWMPSHNFTDRAGDFDEWEFMSNVGKVITTTDGKSEMVRRIVTKILSVSESSLVVAPADPYAKVLVDGKPLNVDKSSATRNTNIEDYNLRLGNEKFQSESNETQSVYKEQKAYFVFSKEKSGFSLKDENRDNQTKPNELEVKMSDLETKLNQLQDTYTVLMLNNKALQESFSELSVSHNTSLEKLELSKNKVLSLEAELTAQKDSVEFANSYLKQKKEELLNLHTKKNNGKTNETIALMIDKASNKKELEGLFEEYGGELFEKYAPHCAKCGSTEMSFKQSKDYEDTDKNEKDKPMRLSDYAKLEQIKLL